MTPVTLVFLGLAGAWLTAGAFFLYVHLQKGYVGERPAALQWGCGLAIGAGMFLLAGALTG